MDSANTPGLVLGRGADFADLRRRWLAEESAAFTGWDFSRLAGRMTSETTPWDYLTVVGKYLRPEYRLLDMGTGGGEFLLNELHHPYRNTYVTESYPPNYELCLQRLAPLGITVKRIGQDEVIPYVDEEFDIVINRHESFDAAEVFRVLKPGGVFITQQVGDQDVRELSEMLIGDYVPDVEGHDLAANQSLLADAGFNVIESGEAFPGVRISDVGALVYFAKIIEWQFPGFTVDGNFDALLNAQRMLDKDGFIGAREHRFYLVGAKPGD